MKTPFPAGVAMAALLLLTSASVAADQSDPAKGSATKPGEGVLCLWALTSVAADVGKRCPGKRDTVFQSALEESVGLLDRYVTANGNWSAERIEDYKKQQGGLGPGKANLCSTAGLRFCDVMQSQRAAVLRASVRKAVERPGMPAWGDCF
jgi:hypothetical protein